jgi:hypothetical protein
MFIDKKFFVPLRMKGKDRIRSLLKHSKKKYKKKQIMFHSKKHMVADSLKLLQLLYKPLRYSINPKEDFALNLLWKNKL